MALGKNKKSKASDKVNQGIGKIWSKEGEYGEMLSFTTDINVKDENGEYVNNGQLVLALKDSKTGEVKYYNLLSMNMREIDSDNPKAPRYSLYVDLNNEYHVQEHED